MARRQRTRDSWNVWRGKVNLKLDEYDPATIVAILEQLDIQNEKIALLREDMNGVKRNIVTLNGQMTEALSSIGALQTRVGTNEGNIATLQSSMLEAQGNIAALGGRMTTAEGNIDSLQTAMSTAQSDITQAKNDIVDLQSTTANLQGRMTTAEGNITGLRTDVDANAAGLLAAQGNITTLQGDMTTAKSDITGLKGRMTTAENNISTLQTQMGTANTNIGTLQTGLQTANTNISTLQTGLATANTNIAKADHYTQGDTITIVSAIAYLAFANSGGTYYTAVIQLPKPIDNDYVVSINNLTLDSIRGYGSWYSGSDFKIQSANLYRPNILSVGIQKKSGSIGGMREWTAVLSGSITI